MGKKKKAKRPSSAVKCINIKEGMPSVEEARKRLIHEIDKAKSSGFKALKIIHGYGSTGRGGSLKDALRKSLLRRKKEGKIKAFINGERWSIFEADVSEILSAVPELGSDPDLDNYNEGVTLVLL